MKTVLLFLFCFYWGDLFAQTLNSTFLIPKDYKGLIYVFLQQPGADTLPVVDSTQIYLIPGDGVLVTKSNSVDYSITSFYYIDSLGNRQEINTPCSGRSANECINGIEVKGGQYEYYQSKKDKTPLQFILLSVTDSATMNLVKNKNYNKRMSAKISRKLRREFYFEYKPIKL
ncbi:MAG: hypothetical protein QM791_14930 [Ferruginibacter sp.]